MIYYFNNKIKKTVITNQGRGFIRLQVYQQFAVVSNCFLLIHHLAYAGEITVLIGIRVPNLGEMPRAKP
ncbi:hypothetical protein L6452_32831 [Arctium lappa]|uniref:Uncharacterized protein n=1 Tax=Arctium lappa TaxID=4217 RepID=A0ACB8Z5L7_ARCLA|nr:hypothetical protein L6452_32831 [Arctium lappa]